MIDPEKIPNYQEFFFTKDGKVLKNLADLKEELKVMPQDVFNHHANTERNDFSNWVKDVFGHEKLADRISTAKTRQELHDMLEKNVALMIMMDFPSAGKESIKRSQQYVSKRSPRKYGMRGDSVESKIRNEDLKGRIIRYREEGRYNPSKIERTVTETKLDKPKESQDQKINNDIKTENITSHKHKGIRHLIREKKQEIFHGTVIGAVVFGIIILFYYAVLKTF